MLEPGTFALTLLLSFLTALGPLSMDMYLPSLPDIGHSLQAPVWEVQFTISSYLFGFAVGQIVYGPVSDRFGRKPVLLLALILYAVATVGCAAAQSIHELIAARFIQALGGAGSIVLARAVVRDIYSGARAGRELSLMGSITAFAPIVAPMIGGLLQTVVGWRAIFVLLFLFALFSAGVAGRLLPETLKQRTPGPYSVSAMGELYRSVLVHRGFLANLGILSTTFVGLFAWVSGAPVVMQGIVYKLTPLVFGVTFAMAAAGYMSGSYVASRIVMRFGLNRIMGIGCVIMAAGGLLMAAVVALNIDNVILFVGTMTVYLAGMGFVLPMAMAAALTPFPDRAGTASSLMGFVQQTSAAVTAGIIGLYLGHSAWPVAGTVATMGCVALLIWALTRRGRAAEL
ncbi:MAG TPA: multidrug effflux MFS transporter [Xanthobacteraceae bacterium]|jgi:DHA1 family bicyclomycin/chloramphenicol resistance-like MFS transporter|nr:multidrug effflux MFS transporter [Xanthobacteraceae bacterium]